MQLSVGVASTLGYIAWAAAVLLALGALAAIGYAITGNGETDDQIATAVIRAGLAFISYKAGAFAMEYARDREHTVG